MQDVLEKDVLSRHIDVDHADLTGNFRCLERAAHAKSGVIDKNIYAAADEILTETDQVLASGQVCRQQKTLCSQFSAQCFETVAAARDENQGIAFQRQAPGKFHADS